MSDISEHVQPEPLCARPSCYDRWSLHAGNGGACQRAGCGCAAFIQQKSGMEACPDCAGVGHFATTDAVPYVTCVRCQGIGLIAPPGIVIVHTDSSTEFEPILEPALPRDAGLRRAVFGNDVDADPPQPPPDTWIRKGTG